MVCIRSCSRVRWGLAFLMPSSAKRDDWDTDATDVREAQVVVTESSSFLTTLVDDRWRGTRWYCDGWRDGLGRITGVFSWDWITGPKEVVCILQRKRGPCKEPGGTPVERGRDEDVCPCHETWKGIHSQIEFKPRKCFFEPILKSSLNM